MLYLRSVVTAIVAYAASTGAAEISPAASNSEACAIRASVKESPDHYLIATVEHDGKGKCFAEMCTETVKLVRSYSHRLPRNVDVPLTINLLMPGLSSSGSTPKGFKQIGVFVPAPIEGSYLPSFNFGPVTYADESRFANSVQLALSSKAIACP